MDSKFFTSRAKQQDLGLLPLPSPPAVYLVNKKALPNATKLGSCFFFLSSLRKSQNYVFLYADAQVELQWDRQLQRLEQHFQLCAHSLKWELWA